MTLHFTLERRLERETSHCRWSDRETSHCCWCQTERPLIAIWSDQRGLSLVEAHVEFKDGARCSIVWEHVGPQRATGLVHHEQALLLVSVQFQRRSNVISGLWRMQCNAMQCDNVIAWCSVVQCQRTVSVKASVFSSKAKGGGGRGRAELVTDLQHCWHWHCRKQL